MENVFLGVAYYPEAWEKERVTEDLDNMVRYGIGCVRIAEFAWKTMEPQEGKFDFSLFRLVVDECKKRGISVIIGTPGACPPIWLSQKCPDVYAKFINDKKGHNGARRLTCFSNADYIYYTDRITEKMAQEFGKDENVIGWQIDNEIWSTQSGMGCVCPTCVAAFRKWVEKKYDGDVEKFNREVGRGVFSTAIDSFDELDRPYEQWTNPGELSLWMQYKRDESTTYIIRQREIIRKYSSAPIGTDTMPTLMAMSYENTAAEMDVMQFNQYYYGDMKPLAVWYSYMYGCKEKPFWLTETSCCWNGSEISNYMRPRGFVGMNGWLALASGAQNVNYWLWRTHYGAHELMHGSVIDSSGRDRHIKDEVMEFARQIERNVDIIAHTKPAYSGIKVMMSSEGDVLFNRQGMYKYNSRPIDYGQLVNQFAADLNDERLNPAVIPENGKIEDAKVLVTPLLACLERNELGKKILAWVEGGGTWIAGPLTDIRTASHAKYRDAFTGMLEKAADVTIQFTMPAYEENSPGYREIGLNYDGASIKAKQISFDAIIPGKSAQTIMTYENESYLQGYAAATVTPYGKGKIVVMGCLPQKEGLMALIKHFAEEKGIRANVKASNNVFSILREGDAGVVQAFVEIGYDKGVAYAPFDGVELLSGKHYGEGSEIELPPYGVALLKKS